jgi:hypothetical protein
MGLPRILDGDQIPFDVRRVFYPYDVAGGEDRRGHAHRGLHPLINNASGSFDVIVDNGTEHERFSLDRSWYGLPRAADGSGTPGEHVKRTRQPRARLGRPRRGRPPPGPR